MKGPSAPTVLPPNSPRRFRPQTALYAGFGALLALMAIMSVDALRILRAIETSDTQIRRNFLERERTLAQVRSGLYESGNLVRDYVLLKLDRHAQEELQIKLASVRDETNSELSTRIESMPPESRGPFQHLAVELEHYWSTLDPVFKWDVREKLDRGELFFRNDVVSQNSAVLAITKEVSSVNTSELKDGENRIAAVFEQFRRRWQIVSVAAFGLGLLLAGATILHTSRLEKNVEDRYKESLQAQRELRELSNRLVNAQEQERRAISRELHDEVGQSLGALLMDVENLAAAPGEDESARQGLKNIKKLAENCLNEVRNIALLLRPSMLDDFGLVAALEWQARDVSKRTGLRIQILDQHVSDNLPEESRTCIYRIVQEALHNCSKHSHAKSVQVTVRQETDRLWLTIQDDGKGFDPNAVRGLGLVGMSERVSQLGGTLHVDSGPGRGTCLRVELPVRSVVAVQDRVAS